MPNTIRVETHGQTGLLTLDRPKALNSLSLVMIRTLTRTLLAWRNDPAIAAVLIRSSSEKAFCAGGDIRFFYDAGRATPAGGSALLEDFFTEEYALNHLIHHYPKPYIALMDGVVMGGGMGIAQSGPETCLRIVTERTKMAMPEVNIGLFPDVGGSYFLPRVPGQLGNYLGVTGETIGAADALYASLADVYVPSAQLPALDALIAATPGQVLADAIRAFTAPFLTDADPAQSNFAQQRALIDRHFGHATVAEIVASLASDDHPFAQKTLAVLNKRSPLMMCVTLELLKRGGTLGVADCLRLERSLVRRCFEHREILEGVRALVIDKDNAPRWDPAHLKDVSPHMVNAFFEPPWPEHAHPLRDLLDT
ncbi:MAG: enoyl-CoA hydratase/isomerase family protein [Burkholderiaceae bacterium]|nr:enoyl-CoA hydratase/isomerase family protein [Burkholderiaceae bacterium]